MPGRRKWPPMRSSRPIAWATTRDVGADLLAHVGDLVDERDLGGQEGVGGVLDHLGAGRVGADDRRRRGRRRAASHGVAVGARLGADHDPVGLHEVGDGAALAQELGVRDVADVLQAARVQLGPQPSPVPTGTVLFITSTNRSPVCGQLVDHAVHAREVGVAGVRRRRVDADEHDPAAVEHLGQVEREREAVAVALEQPVDARLVDRHPAVAQRRRSAPRVDVDGR